MKKVVLALILTLITPLFLGCSGQESIVIGEGSWDSNRFHDEVARIIIEEGYGVDVDIVPADTPVMVTGLISKDVNLTMELWSDNVVSYNEDIEKGRYVEVGTNFDDNYQGLYIPAYLQAENPGLVSVQDLPDYVNLFPDPEDSSKGIIYGGTSSWAATAFLEKKIVEYGLDEYFNFKTIEQTAVLNTTLASAYDEREAWVGYNWEPTWVLGQYEMVLLEDSEYNAEDYEKGIGAFPSVDVNICVDSDFEEKYPEIFTFLSKYSTSSVITSKALAYMQTNDAEDYEAAEWFLLENTDIWQDWVTDDAFLKIMEYLG